jgi:Lsr2
MAQKTLVVVVDDLTDELLSEGRGQTVRFGFDGVDYEIDLSKENADELRAAFKRYVDAGRRVSQPARGRRSRGDRGGQTTSVTRRQDATAIRAWAKEQGRQVSERGRISRSVVEAYEAAH